jgi:CRISPR-associated protein Cst2
MTVQGFILIDEEGVALNNSGTVQVGGTENRVATKKISKHGQQYTYVSGQAWRYWWRETLEKHFNWKMSPLTKLEKQNVIFTEANPILYSDDDIFGYMRANKEPVLDANGIVKKKKNGEVETKDATVTRISPLKNSILVSVGAVRVATNFASASRQNDVPVLYGKEEYSTIMKGMFSLDLNQVGTFATYNKTGFKNLGEKLLKTAIDEKLEFLDDRFVKTKEGNPEKLFRLSKDTRVKRVSDTIQALKFISGGAMQTSNMGDVTPKFIILATFTTGNHPFSHVVKNDPFTHEAVILNIDGIKEVLNDYKDQFQGTIFIGKRSGFMDEYNKELTDLETEFNGTKEKIIETNADGKEVEKERTGLKVKFVTVNQAIDQYCEQVKTQIT